MAKPKVWLVEGGRFYAINHAAKLLGTTATKLRKMAADNLIEIIDTPQEGVAESDVLRIRKERSTMAREVQHRSDISSAAPKLKDVQRRGINHRDRPADQPTLNWSRFKID